MTQFKLQPFSIYPNSPTLSGSIHWVANQLQVSWQLTGQLEQFDWPVRNEPAGRETGLWKSTCFEFFVSDPKSTPYYEFNFSPSGNWQSFSFSDYRTNMHSCSNLVLREQQVARYPQEITINISVECSIAENVTKKLKAGICAILLDRQGVYHYYALRHGNCKPDFHSKSDHSLILVPDHDTA